MVLSGVVLTAQSLSGRNAAVFTVRATDGGNRQTTAVVNISFHAFPTSSMPTFQSSSSDLVMSEGRPINAQLTKVTAIPQSSSGTILYSIAGGNVADTFSIKSDGKIVLNKKLDYAVASSFDLWIAATDSSNGIHSYKNIKVTVQDINDHDPEFKQALYITSVLEEQSILGARELVRVEATDPDSGINGEITYSLIEGNIGNPFVLSQDGILKLIKKLDREFISRYDLVILARDGGGRNSTTLVIVNVEDINDKFPRFELIYTWNIPEDTPIGTVVSAVRARDSDIGANANIVYALDRPSSHFDVTPTGNVTVKAELDRETTSSYEVVISASNTGPENVISGTTTVQIMVC